MCAYVLTGFLQMFIYLNMHVYSCELIHLVTAGKEDRVSFSDGKSKCEINFGLGNCYQFLELIIIITVLCRVPEGSQSEQCCLNVSEMLSLPQGEPRWWCRSRTVQVVGAVLLGTPEGEPAAEVMAAEPGSPYVQDVADGVQKETGWLAAGTSVMKHHRSLQTPL